VTDDVPILTTTLRLVVTPSKIESAVTSEPLTTSSAMVLAAVESRAHFVTPPLKGERPDGDDVAVAHARAREKAVDPEFAEAMDDLGEGLIVGEILKANRASGRATVHRPGARSVTLERDLLGHGPVHDDLVLECVGFFVARARDESRQRTH
jgi:hypothetical protein